MSAPSAVPSGEPIDPTAALRQARTRFIAAFDARCDSIRLLADAPSATVPSPVLRQVVHRLAGLAGMVGFPSVSARARELEERVLAGDPAPVLHAGLERLVDAFSHDFAADVDEWGLGPAGDPLQVMVAGMEGTTERLDAALAALGAGVMRVPVGDIVSSAAMDLPDLLLLPADAPGPDGTPGGAWLRLRSEPVTSALPIVVLTTVAGVPGLGPNGALSPDDVLLPTTSTGEAVARLRRLQSRAPANGRRPRVLAYDVFLLAVRDLLAQRGGALALVHGRAARLPQVAEQLVAEFGRADLIAAIDATHLAILVPDLTAGEVATRLQALAAREASANGPVSAGVAPAARGAQGVSKLVEAANRALGEALRARVAAASLEAPPPVSAQGPRVVVVRVGASADTAIAALRGAGLDTQVIEAADPAMPPAHAADAALVDVCGPTGVALGTLERVARACLAPALIALVPDAGLVAEAFRLGVTDCVVVPGEPADLVARVRHATW